MILLRYVQDELSYDRHHVNKENIYRIDSEFIINGNHNKSGHTPSPLAKAMKADLPEVLESTRIFRAGTEHFLIAYEDQSFFDQRITFADSNFFDVLTYEFIVGDRATSLDQPFSVVLSDKIASKLFHTTTPEYMQLMGFELLAGRLFDPNRLADTNSTVVITEAAMKGIGFDLDNAIGQDITLNWEENQTFKVIGVIKDYHAQSLHEEIEGQIYDWSPAWPTKYVMASIDPQNLPTLLSQLESTWEQFNPKEPFEFQFLEDRLQENYLAEQQMSQLVQWGTGLAILICCLGLLGLIGFAADRRAKEISIRKILGASVPNIITLLSKEFILLVLIAFVIAAPISWYLMTQWLNDFAYHITMPWWAFLLSAIVAIGITVLTIAFQSVKAAVGNPVDTLRSE